MGTGMPRESRACPPISEILQPTDRPETFGALRSWLRGAIAERSLSEEAQLVGSAYRCAVLLRLQEEARGGVRQNQAKELLREVLNSEAWAGEVVLSEEDLRSRASVEAPPPASSVLSRVAMSAHGAAADSACCLAAGRQSAPRSTVTVSEALAGMPSIEELHSPREEQLVFETLRNWVRTKRQTRQLEEAGACIGSQHRHAIVRFLLNFSEKKRLFKGRAQELLAQFRCLEGWCSDLEHQFPELLLPPRAPPSIMRPTSSTPAEGPSVEAARNKEGSDIFRQQTALAAPAASRPALSEAALDGLPSSDLLEDSSAHGQEVFRAVKAWVRARGNEGNLVEVGAHLPLAYRRNLLGHLSRRAASRCIFRMQAAELFHKIAAIDEWKHGLNDADLQLVELPISVDDGPYDGALTVNKPPSDGSGERLALATSQTFRSKEGTPLPTQLALQDLQADQQELFKTLCSWVWMRKRSAQLENDAKLLSLSHRRSIFCFLCDYVSRERLQKRKSSVEISQEVLGLLAELETWRQNAAANEARLAAALSSAPVPAG
ncbi:unnamed protein product [Polarella glacialis]|uniref:Uncharacterized protein n=1 Tax=Polarella glacialis TaxID=89957 RepID=A0A813K906_POLGL|nr:unnamed protein product [Polarella glacialis]CAE8700477.1 unnamed protein product [Polarella glacialis]